MAKKIPTHGEKVKAGHARAAAYGRFPGRPQTVSDEEIRRAIPLGSTAGARSLGMSVRGFLKRRKRLEEG